MHAMKIFDTKFISSSESDLWIMLFVCLFAVQNLRNCSSAFPDFLYEVRVESFKIRKMADTCFEKNS